MSYATDGPGIESRLRARFPTLVLVGPVVPPTSCTKGTGSLARGKAEGAWR